MKTIAVLVTLGAIALPACSGSSGNSSRTGGSSGAAAGGSSGGQGGSAGSGGQSASGGVAGSGGISGSGGLSSAGGAATGGSSGADGGTSPGACVPANAIVCDTMVPFPATIKETGLFPALPDMTKRHEKAHLFQPNPELWSDGLGKDRFIILPAGKTIDNSDSLKWKFPKGTVLVKNFYDDSGANKTPHPVETRFVRYGQDPADPFSQWEFVVYQWNAQGTDATLISFDDAAKTTPVQVVVDRMENGKPMRLNEGKAFTHNIPSKQDCQSCHEANAKLTGAEFIGFDELRLNWKLPGASKTQLENFVDKKVLSTLPAAPKAIVDADPLQARVKSWIHGNCAHCHNGTDGIVDLRPDVFVKNVINMDPQGSGIMPPSTDWKRVVPKKPELSVLFVQSRRAPLPTGSGVQMRAMPPVGVEVGNMNRPDPLTDPPEYVGKLPPTTFASQVPEDAIADLAKWINSLP